MKMLHFKISRIFPAAMLCGVLFLLACGAVDEADPAVVFSRESGAYTEPFDLRLAAPEGWTIYYTTDGSLPERSSEVYSGPIRIEDINGNENRLCSAENIALMHYEPVYSYVPAAEDVPKANVIRAAALSPDGKRSTQVSTATYFIGDTYTNRWDGLMVVQLIVDPDDLLDYDRGIFATGAVFDAWKDTEDAQKFFEKKMWWHIDANYSRHGRTWERPAAVELFDGSDSITCAAPAGVRVHGGASRMFGQRSLCLYFREDYGLKRLDYPLFPDLTAYDGTGPVSSYKSFMLRNGGNECNYTKFVDVMIGDAASCLHVMTQAARPCVLFINGEFWGILNLQEKWTDQSVEDRYGVARSNVVIIKNASVEEGTEEDISLYDELMSWADRDLSDDAAYREFCGIVDIDSMIDFCAVKCFFGDRDWFQYKNEALWRSRSIVPGDPWADGKWRWMLFDTDQTMGLFDKEEDQPEYNFIPYAMEVDPLFGSVMANESFRRAFLARLRYLCGVPDDGTEDASVENDPAFGVFSTEEMTERIERYAAEYRPFFSENFIRFGFMKEGIFEERVEYMKRFVALRPGYILSYAEAAVEGSFT